MCRLRLHACKGAWCVSFHPTLLWKSPKPKRGRHNRARKAGRRWAGTHKSSPARCLRPAEHGRLWCFCQRRPWARVPLVVQTVARTLWRRLRGGWVFWGGRGRRCQSSSSPSMKIRSMPSRESSAACRARVRFCQPLAASIWALVSLTFSPARWRCASCSAARFWCVSCRARFKRLPAGLRADECW